MQITKTRNIETKSAAFQLGGKDTLISAGNAVLVHFKYMFLNAIWVSFSTNAVNALLIDYHDCYF